MRQDGAHAEGRTVSDLIPSERWPDGFTALAETVQGGRSLSVAVAFVTDTGAAKLIELIEPLGLEVEVVARAGAVTSPSALQALRDRLGAKVSVAIGEGSMRFHPKLWLVRGDCELAVLSGSGNLTLGGLQQNFEQFELTKMPLDSDEATAQEERFIELTASAFRLESIEGTVAWSSWEQMIIKSKSIRNQLQQWEKKLAEVPVKPKPGEAHKELLDDLYSIYDATVARNMVTPQGNLYRPTRFLVGINRARDGGDPVEMISRLCRRQTGGFDIILQYNEPHLTVESLVVDAKKKYHELFTPKTRELAAQRLDQFLAQPS